MTTKHKLGLLAINFIFTSLTSVSQTAGTIDRLEKIYQSCLDKGVFMPGCSERFYFQMDSLLNVHYIKLRAKCDKIQKINLKDDQLKWLAIRKKKFAYNRQQIHKEAKENGFDGGLNEAMILTDKNARFVKNRVLEILNNSPDNYSADKYKSKVFKVSTE